MGVRGSAARNGGCPLTLAPSPARGEGIHSRATGLERKERAVGLSQRLGRREPPDVEFDGEEEQREGFREVAPLPWYKTTAGMVGLGAGGLLLVILLIVAVYHGSGGGRGNAKATSTAKKKPAGTKTRNTNPRPKSTKPKNPGPKKPGVKKPGVKKPGAKKPKSKK